jgi:2-methylcitrate dehydratase PrpD
MARICLLDVLGCALAGTGSEDFPMLVKTIQCMSDKAEPPIWGTDIKTGLAWSIFLNIHAAAYFDIDDGHRKAQGHPVAAIVPAALCVAAHTGAPARLCSRRLSLALTLPREVPWSCDIWGDHVKVRADV